MRNIIGLVVVTSHLWTVFILLSTSSTLIQGQNVAPSKEVILQWAKVLENNLGTYIERVSGQHILEQEYSKLENSELKPLKGDELVTKMAASLAAALGKKVKALKKLVSAAEDLVRSYKYDPEIQLDDVSWVSMKDFSENDHRLSYSHKFRKGVNFSYSGVHIPVDIYKGDPEILNGLKWSQGLDRVFRENLENDTDLLWQYFGSQTGFMRTYPANKWLELKDQPDLYDVRRRPWYIHGSSSPKDMLILMDTSGSMHGQTMGIMKLAVKMLLNTLGENDFVNVASFSNKAEWVTCFDTFVQATRLNKRILNQGIDELKDGNMASLSLAFEFAFDEFEKFKRPKQTWEGAHCNRIIMLFTDGGTEEPWSVLELRNRFKQIRIFVFAIGPHPIPVAIVKKIACENRGYFSTIGAMGSIRTKVQEYVKVLSRPMVLSDRKEFEWTNFYVDAMGLGMMTTVTLPVFNRTSGGDKQSIVGVMGVDVTLQEMMDFSPLYKLGPAGYAFAINPNGFVVFHPDLETPSDYLDDPPHIDIAEVETENPDLLEVRKKMIDREVNRTEVASLIKLPDERHMVHYTMKYFFRPVNNTSFSLAVVIPKHRDYYLKVRNMDTNKRPLFADDEIEGVLLAPWNYCKNYSASGNVSEITESINELLHFIRFEPNLCDENLVQRFLWDVEKTRKVYSYWSEEDKKLSRNYVRATFVMTEGGLTRVYPPSEAVNLAEHRDPRKTVYFERALYSKEFVYIPPPTEVNDVLVKGSRETVITAVRQITLQSSQRRYQPAVVGVQLDPSFFHTQLTKVPMEAKFKHKLLSCDDVDQAMCYLVDDGGFVVASNQQNYLQNVGKFLGFVDPEMMQEMLDKEIFDRFTEYNFEAMCMKERKVSTASRTVKFVLHDVIQAFSIRWLFDVAAWAQIRSWLYSLFSSSMMWQESAAVPEFAIAPSDKRPCTTIMARYYLKDKKFDMLQNETKCNNCSRPYSIARLSESNLLLVVSSHPCAALSCDPIPALLQSPREDKGPDLCHQQLRYRRRPEECFHSHQNENYSDCGASADIPHSSATVTLTLGILTCIWMIIHC